MKMLIKCEKCYYYDFPEPDEDGHFYVNCRHPKVIGVFNNFFRKNKCKYYRKIKYEQLLKECKNQVSDFQQFSFYYRDRRWRAIPTYRIKRFWRELEHYLELRNYLFNEVKRRNCSYACFQDSYRDYKADCSICIDNKDLDELKRAKRSYIPKFKIDKNKEKVREGGKIND